MGADEDRAPEDVAAGDGEEASAGGKKGRYRRDKPWVSPPPPLRTAAEQFSS